MANGEKLTQRWENFRPSKAVWLWTAVGASVATMVVGFTWGGWTTGGTAGEMAEAAARDARAELASAVCIENFTHAGDAAAQLAALKEVRSYQQDDFIADGGWATLVGMEQPVPGAALRCAEQLAVMDELPAPTVDLAPSQDG